MSKVFRVFRTQRRGSTDSGSSGGCSLDGIQNAELKKQISPRSEGSEIGDTKSNVSSLKSNDVKQAISSFRRIQRTATNRLPASLRNGLAALRERFNTGSRVQPDATNRKEEEEEEEETGSDAAESSCNPSNLGISPTSETSKTIKSSATKTENRHWIWLQQNLRERIGELDVRWVPPADIAAYSKYDFFRTELSQAPTVHESIKDCIAMLVKDKDYSEDLLLEPLTKLINQLFRMSWRTAENVFQEDLAKLQTYEAQLKESNRQRIHAIESATKEVASLRTQLRKAAGRLPSDIDNISSVSFFDPVDHLDGDTKTLVRTVVDEELKTIVSQLDTHDNALNKFLRQKVDQQVDIYREKVAREERKRFSVKLEEQSRVVVELEQRLACLQSDHAKTKEEANKLGLLQKLTHEQSQDRMLEHEQQVSTLKEDIKALTAENRNLLDQLISAQVKLDKAAEPPHRELPKLPEFTSEVEFSHQIQQMLAKNLGDRREVLPGASAATLMEHATKLHVDSDHEVLGDDYVELLIVLVRLVEQIATEIRQEIHVAIPACTKGGQWQHVVPFIDGVPLEDHILQTDDFWPQACKEPWLLVGLKALQSTVAQRQAAMSTVLGALMLNSFCNMLDTLQCKGTPTEFRLSTATRQLKEIQRESKKHISKCFTVAQSGYEQLQAMRLQLKQHFASLDDESATCTPESSTGGSWSVVAPWSSEGSVSDIGQKLQISKAKISSSVNGAGRTPTCTNTGKTIVASSFASDPISNKKLDATSATLENGRVATDSNLIGTLMGRKQDELRNVGKRRSSADFDRATTETDLPTYDMSSACRQAADPNQAAKPNSHLKSMLYMKQVKPKSSAPAPLMPRKSSIVSLQNQPQGGATRLDAGQPAESSSSVQDSRPCIDLETLPDNQLGRAPTKCMTPRRPSNLTRRNSFTK